MATNGIRGKQLADYTIGPNQIAPGAVTPSKADLTQVWAWNGVTPQSNATPVNANDLANKNYVDSLVNGLEWKQAVIATTSQPIANLTGLLMIDGYQVQAGDRVGVIGQVNGIQNGIYVAALGAWARASDLAVGASAAGVAFATQAGLTNAGKAFTCTNVHPADVVGTDALTFVFFSNAQGYTIGNGLQLQGNTISVKSADASITVGNGGVAVGYSPATPNACDASPGSPGVAVTAAKSDHQHLINTSTPVAVALQSSAGSSMMLVKADHRHASPNLRPVNAYQTPNACQGANGLSTGLTLAVTPALGTAPTVSLNGVIVRCGSQNKALDCYYSDDGGSTSKNFAALVAGDTLYWNALTSGIPLDANDLISQDYLSFLP